MVSRLCWRVVLNPARQAARRLLSPEGEQELTDFYLGLALCHFVVGIATLVSTRRARWLGAAVVIAALALGVLTSSAERAGHVANRWAHTVVAEAPRSSTKVTYARFT